MRTKPTLDVDGMLERIQNIPLGPEGIEEYQRCLGEIRHSNVTANHQILRQAVEKGLDLLGASSDDLNRDHDDTVSYISSQARLYPS